MTMQTFGLFDPSDRTPPAQPCDRGMTIDFTAANRCHQSLYKLLEQIAGDWFEWPIDGELKSVNLIDVMRSTPCDSQATHEQLLATLPPCWHEILTWDVQRSQEMRDEDGFELIRAMVLRYGDTGLCPGMQALSKRILGGGTPLSTRESEECEIVAGWLLRFKFTHEASAAVRMILDAVELSFAIVAHEAHIARQRSLVKCEETEWEWRNHHESLAWLSVATMSHKFLPSGWTRENFKRYWSLLRFFDEPGGMNNPEVARMPPALDTFLKCFDAGVVNDADTFDFLLYKHPHQWPDYEALMRFALDCERRVSGTRPRLAALGQRTVAAIVEAEINEQIEDADLIRHALQAPRSWTKLEKVVHCLSRIDDDFYYKPLDHSVPRSPMWGYIVETEHISMDAGTTLEQFAALCRSYAVSRDVLISFAMRNPKYAPMCEFASGVVGLAEGVYFTVAHAGDFKCYPDECDLKLPHLDMGRFTTLPVAMRSAGVIDVKWFRRVHATLGQNWKEVSKRMPLQEQGKRIQLCCEAILGKKTIADLEKSMLKQRNQAAVIAYGLLPLPENDRKAVLHRVHQLRQFILEQKKRKMGAERKRNEMVVVDAAMQNLAQIADISADVFDWIIEADEADTLTAIKPLSIGPVTMEITFDELGCACLGIEKAGRALKTVPAAVKKDSAGKSFIDHYKNLAAQHARFRERLEEAMMNMTSFPGDLLQQLWGHPILQPMLGRLVWVSGSSAGWLVEQGAALRQFDGSLEPVSANDTLTLAHPAVLAQNEELSAWQRACFRQEIVQPFRQLFREFYLPTSAEKRTGRVERFSGLVVQGRKASGILSKRGWCVEEGAFVKKFSVNSMVELWLKSPTHTPWDEEELTLMQLHFSTLADGDTETQSDWQLAHFSETLRDVDLAVSVCFADGGQLSESILAGRRSVLAETLTALNLKNVKFVKNQAIVSGQKATYSVHLGSGVVHLPSGQQLALTVEDEREQKLFLPFADRDPAIARIVAAVLLLVDDAAITDTAILDQITS